MKARGEAQKKSPKNVNSKRQRAYGCRGAESGETHSPGHRSPKGILAGPRAIEKQPSGAGPRRRKSQTRQLMPSGGGDAGGAAVGKKRGEAANPPGQNQRAVGTKRASKKPGEKGDLPRGGGSPGGGGSGGDSGHEVTRALHGLGGRGHKGAW